MWYNFVQSYADSRAKVLFVGCKLDKLKSQELIQELQEFAEARDSTFIPVSAKQDINVDYLFLEAISLALSRQDCKDVDGKDVIKGFKLNSPKKNFTRKCC